MELSQYTYRCDLHCYNQETSDAVKDLVSGLDILRVKAHKINSQTGQPYPAEQTFFISRNDNILKEMDSVITDNNIPSCWVSNDCTIDWSNYCDVVQC